MSDPTPVTFVEREGPGADATLRRLRDRLARAGTPSRLLASSDRDDLRLLVIEGDADLDADATHGARVWRFVPADVDGTPA